MSLQLSVLPSFGFVVMAVGVSTSLLTAVYLSRKDDRTSVSFSWAPVIHQVVSRDVLKSEIH